MLGIHLVGGSEEADINDVWQAANHYFIIYRKGIQARRIHYSL